MRKATKRGQVPLAAGAVLIGVMAFALPASARSDFQDDGTGITCGITGFITFDPPLTTTATGTSMVKFHDRLHGCLGAVTQFGLTIATGTENTDGSEAISSNCLRLAEAPSAVPPFVMKTRYLPRGGSPAPDTYTSWAAGSAHITLTSPLVISYTDAASVTGSFSSGSGPPPSLTEVVDQTVSAVLSECQSTSGVKELTFTGVNGASSVTLG